MSDLPEHGVEEYLGDGLYASFDGWNIRLRAPREHGDHWVALERDLFQSLLNWMEKYPVLWEHFSKPRW